MGPIAVASHLAPYLPGHPVVKVGGNKAIPAIAAAPWGSASILLISYGYIRMLGAAGMTDATRYAILNANYLKARLQRPLRRALCQSQRPGCARDDLRPAAVQAWRRRRLTNRTSRSA